MTTSPNTARPTNKLILAFLLVSSSALFAESPRAWEQFHENPGKDKVCERWPRKTISSHSGAMFMVVADVNGDAIEDFVIAGGSSGANGKQILVLLRTNRSGDPKLQEIVIDQPGGSFPKGIAVFDLDGDPRKKEIIVIPKAGDLWMATFTGDSMKAASWKATLLQMLGAATRRKMDNAWLGDLDGDTD